LGEGEKKLLSNLLVVGLVGLIVMLSFGFFGKGTPSKTPTPTPQPQASPPQESLQRELAGILSKIRGAGQVQVAITMEGSGRREYATNRKETTKDSQQDDSGGKKTSIETVVETQKVLVKGDGMREEALLERELTARVQGVLIVASGAGDDAVSEKLARSAATFLGVGQNRIVVMEGK
jgi:stage III sporulation protein AG